MEKLNREEILCLIENIGDVAIMLGNDYIDVIVKNQKYSKFLTELDIQDVKCVAEKYIRSVATTFNYENDVNYKFEFDEITISSKILYENESWYSHKIGLNENEIDMFIDNRFEEAKSINNCDDDYNNSYDDDYAKEYNEEYDDTYDDYHCDDDYPYIDDEDSSANIAKDNLIDSLNNDLDDCLSKE